MTIIAPQPLRSLGNYLTLADAAVIIGTACVDGWRKNDLAQLLSPDQTRWDEDALTRSNEAVQRLRHWLIGDQISAFTTDDEGAYDPVEANRRSKPYFDIDVEKSLFKWSPEDWAAMFIDRRSLTAHLASIVIAKPRKTIVFEWEKVASIAWKQALAMPIPRKTAPLITSIQLRCADELACEPDTKELRPVVDDIIRHLEGHTLSRDVSTT